MSLELCLCYCQKLTPEQKLEQKLEQGLKLERRLNQDRLVFDLIEALKDKKFSPKAICFKCNHNLNSVEIMKGFVQDPLIIETVCPKCGNKFAPSLIHSHDFGNTSLMYYCRDQTLNVFKDQEQLTPEELEKLNMSAYYSAIVHYGTIKNMFSRINIKYKHSEKMDKKKIYPFLGKMSDGTISKYSGISCSSIGRYRRAKGIPVFDRTKNIEED